MLVVVQIECCADTLIELILGLMQVVMKAVRAKLEHVLSSPRLKSMEEIKQ